MLTKRTYYIAVLFLLLGSVFVACKKTELEPEATTLVVKVKDDLGNDIVKNSLTVFLFDDSTAFRKAWQNDDFSGVTYSTLLTGGAATFSDIDPDKNYWVYIDYFNTQGAQINNFFTQNTLKNLLENGTTTTVVIQLTPYKTGNIAFYSTEVANQDDLLIDVFFDGVSVGTINNLSASTPSSLTDPNVVKVLYQQPGDHSYYAVGNNGCVWQGVVNVKSGTNDFSTVNLTGCEFGYLNFWIKGTNLQAYGNIDVVFNDDDNVGTLSVSREATPTNCEKVNVLQVARPAGKYVVHAYAKNKQCVWVQTVDVKAGCQNSPIEFKDCN